MDSPLVSIIIPLYNAENFISDTINSVINQTWKNIEVFIIDDGSTDHSFTIAKSFENNYIKVLRQDNKGASAARNAGLKKAKGKYVQFLDADDLISPEKLEIQIKQLENYEGYLSICSTAYFSKNEELPSIHPELMWTNGFVGNAIDFLTKLHGGSLVGPGYGGMITVHSWLSPKTILDEAGLWNTDLSVDDDGEYFCRVVTRAKGICHAAGAINYYRKQVKNSLSSQLTLRGFQSMLLATQLKYEVLQGILPTDLLKKVFILHYQQIVTAAYPKFKDVSKLALEKAKELGLEKVEYVAGPFSMILARILGWKMARYITYLRFGF